VFFKYSKRQMNPLYLRKITKWPNVYLLGTEQLRTLLAICVCASILTCLNLVVRLLVLPCIRNSRYRTHYSLRSWFCMHSRTRRPTKFRVLYYVKWDNSTSSLRLYNWCVLHRTLFKDNKRKRSFGATKRGKSGRNIELDLRIRTHKKCRRKQVHACATNLE
jgi:hypothetical protein